MIIRSIDRSEMPAVREMMGDRIRRFRVQRGWSRARLAQTSGIDVQTIKRAEMGREPSLWSFVAMAQALDVSLDELYGGAS